MAAELLAVALPLVAVVVWGCWAAPQARWRLPDPARLVVDLVLFTATAAGLAAVGLTVTGLVFFVLTAAIAVLVRRYATDS